MESKSYLCYNVEDNSVKYDCHGESSIFFGDIMGKEIGRIQACCNKEKIAGESNRMDE